MNIEKSITWLRKHPVVLIASIFLIIISSTMTVVDGVKRLYGFYKATIGYNQVLDEKLNALNVEVDIGYFTNLLGAPAIINDRHVSVEHVSALTNQVVETSVQFKEYFFVDKEFYVQAVTNASGKVGMYSITARTASYAPIIDTDLGIRIRLGRSTYSEIAKIPTKIAGLVGMNLKHFTYYEIFVFDPGNYRYAILSSNPNGYFDSVGSLDWEIGDLFAQHFLADSPSFPMHGAHSSFRRDTTINTYSVTTPWFDGIDLSEHGVNYGGRKINFGPHVDQISLIRGVKDSKGN